MVNLKFRQPKPFNKRSEISESEKVKKSFYIICEGEKTEKEYFEGIFNNRIDLDINQLIDIKVIEQIGIHIPHPLHLARACKKSFDKLEKQNKCDNDNDIDDIELDLSNYDSKIDEIWLIFDRDPKTFFKEQYEEVDEICDKYKLNIGLTNPNFEFWLLLHLENIDNYDRKELLENKKVGGKNSDRFIKKELEKRLTGGYDKNNIKFKRFMPNISLAIKQVTKFETTKDNAFEKLGSTIGNLLEKMKED
jgi:hypothetical protein